MRSRPFRACGRREHYLYHVAVMCKGSMMAVPYSAVCNDYHHNGCGAFWLLPEVARGREVIDGYGGDDPMVATCFHDRKRRKLTKSKPVGWVAQ